MKRIAFLLAGLAAVLTHPVWGNDAPKGRLLELHSCELYAGGCVVSSESPQSSGYMLQVWDFTGGDFEGQSFAGLKLALLQVSADNLAQPDSRSEDAVVYLPDSATAAQRGALTAWLKSGPCCLRTDHLHTRIVPLQLTKEGKFYRFSAGDFASVQVAPFERCAIFTCGESLWYQPHADSSLFTVAVDRSSKITEPLLRLKWCDAGKRSVFLARFGEPAAAKDWYVTLDQICGPAKSLF